MINYIVQVVFIQALFLGIYDLLLHKETFFKYNRWYLLGTPILSFILPLIQLSSLQYVIPSTVVYQLPAVVLDPQSSIEATEIYQSVNYLGFLFYIGVGVFSVLFCIKLFRILRLLQRSRIVKKEDHSLVLLNKNESAFSFFRYIFIHQNLIEDNQLQVIQHELVHSKQLHTLDLLVFEILKIVMWFNPLIYVFQHRITAVHEYLSDAEVLKNTNKQQYFNNLLTNTFNVENISFVNQFCKHSLLKKRIMMITKNKSKKMKQLKYVLLIPVLFSMLLYTSCEKEVNVQNIFNEAKENEGKLISSGDFHVFIGNVFNGVEIPLEDMSDKELEMNKKWSDDENSVIKNNIVFKLTPEGKRVWHFYVDKKNVAKKLSPETEKRKIEREKMREETKDYVPFATIDQVPVFPGCEDAKDSKKCFVEKIDTHVKRNFDGNMAETLGLSPGVKRIFVMFSIDKEGNVGTVRARAPHKKLEEEAIRVINSLPKMIPGKTNGLPVGIKYSLPIKFKVD
ncbi:MAG: BlaR1 peptidase M56 [Flavobacteriaceae bacterium]|nr:MAG: BlaR1 peptidase M56 [Flavobacteriaceae bacterium]